MAEFSKLKKRNSLGAPPSFDEASQNLAAPEIAPVELPQVKQVAQKIDGRSLRKTNRTIQFATRVTPEYDVKFRDVAARDGLEFCVLLEKMLESYEADR